MAFKNPNDPITYKEYQELVTQTTNLFKMYNDLLRKHNLLKQDVDVKERKLKQLVRNVENKIPRR